jgi:RNA polymerase sigma-70 factor (ECF subfamily)
MTLDNEKALIKKAQRGDARAFEVLVTEYYEVMFRMAYTWCRNERDAEDITQEACIRLAQGIEKFRGDCAFTTWLYRLVINVAKDWFRKNKRHKGEELTETHANAPEGEKQLYTRQMLERVDALPDGEKAAILLVFAEGLSHKEAARILECKESTVSWRIHEARKKLGSLDEEATLGKGKAR